MSDPTIYFFGVQRITGNSTIQGRTVTATGSFQTSNVTTLTSGAIIGTPSAPFGPTFSLGANVGTINVSSISWNPVVTGNLNASNALTVTIISASLLTVPTLRLTAGIAINLNAFFTNASSLVVTSNLGIGTSPGSTNLYVQGNMYASNSLSTTNIFASTVNVAVTTAGYPPPPLNLTVATVATASTNLYIQGNIFSTSITAQNVSTPSISYGEDVTRRSPHLTPSANNGTVIQAWISAQCNVDSQPTRSWWSTSASTSFANVFSSKTIFQGSVLIPDGRVLFVASPVGFYTPKTQLFSSARISAPTGNFGGGLLLPTGNVVLCPQNSNVGIYNPISGAFSNSIVPGAQYSGVLTANNVIFGPQGVPSNVISWNYTTGASSNIISFSSPFVNNFWRAGSLTTPQPWSAVAWSPTNSSIIAVASGSSTMNYSTNGINWSSRALSAGLFWSAVACSSTICVAVGGLSITMNYSLNGGLSWGSGSMTAALNWTSVAWSSQLGLFIAIASSSRTMNYSSDGINWSSGSMTAALSWASVACSSTICVAVGGLSITMNYSSDGINWSSGSMTAALNWTSVAWSSQLGLFVAVAYGSFVMNYSSDGINWTAGSMTAALNWSSVAWSPQLGLFVAVANGSNTMNYSSDGINWTVGSMPATLNWTSVAWYPPQGMFVAVASGSSTMSYLKGPPLPPWSQGSFVSASSIAWSPQLGLFVAVSAFSQASYSSDGINWSRGSFGAGSLVEWSPQLGLFVSIASGSTTYYSSDGINWSQGNSATTYGWTAISWSPQLGRFVAIAGSSSTMNYSSDGINWSSGSMTAALNWSSVAWSPQLGRFVAVAGGSSTMNYSTNGTSWTAGSMTTTLYWTSVAWSPQLGLFVAIPSDFTNFINYSTDGVNWSLGYKADTNQMNVVAWSPQLGIFASVSTNGANTNYFKGPSLQQGVCLLPNGNVIIPSPGTSNVIQFNPVNNRATNIFIGTSGYSSLVLAPNGNVIGVPLNSNILVINPTNFTCSNIITNAGSFNGGCLTISGNVVFTPSSSNVGLFDPLALTYSNSSAAGSGFSGATLVQNGQVVFGPSGGGNVGIYDTLTPAPTEFCLSPYFNKF